MSDYPKIIDQGGEGEIVEKKSRFIAAVSAVHSEKEASAFIESVRKKYWDAGHHCSAFVIGAGSKVSRCSDDGEPSGTAGRPILDVLTGSGVRDACIVVTRYFGGVLLGTGGLVRAYGRAARAGLDASVVLERIPGRLLRVICDYNSIGKIQYLAGNAGLRPYRCDYGADVRVLYLIPEGDVDAFVREVTEATSGRAGIEDLGARAFAVRGSEFVLL